MVSWITSWPSARNARALTVIATVAAVLARPSAFESAGIDYFIPLQKVWMRVQASRRLSVSVA